MKTLSDDLNIQVRTTGMSEGYVTTTVHKDNNLIFSGRSYILGDDSSLNININDFAAQNRNKYDFLKLNDDGKLVSTPIKNVTIGGISEQTRFVPGQLSLYDAVVSDGSNSYTNFSYCFTGYEYPNKDIKPSIIENEYDSLIGRVMQGCDWGYNPAEIQSSWFNNLLIPRYPFKATKKYGMGIQLYTTEDATYYLRTAAGDANAQLKLGLIEEATGNQLFITLEDLYYGGVAVGYGSEFYLKKASNDDAFGKLIDDATPPKYIGNCPIAKFDDCTARYYLAWNDRFGDIQSQPFDGKVEYSENIYTEEIIDYKMRRRPSNKNVQPKWKLNTTWLSSEVYPIYESIFISPYLLLYDTEQDKAWNVIVKDSEYKEKTYKTEKSLFNLEITVEANKTQNMIY